MLISLQESQNGQLILYKFNLFQPIPIRLARYQPSFTGFSDQANSCSAGTHCNPSTFYQGTLLLRLNIEHSFDTEWPVPEIGNVYVSPSALSEYVDL